MILVRLPLDNPMGRPQIALLLRLATLIPRIRAPPLVITLFTILLLNLSINLPLVTYHQANLIQLANTPPADTNSRIPPPNMNITRISNILAPITPMHNYTHQIQTIRLGTPILLIPSIQRHLPRCLVHDLHVSPCKPPNHQHQVKSSQMRSGKLLWQVHQTTHPRDLSSIPT